MVGKVELEIKPEEVLDLLVDAEYKIQCASAVRREALITIRTAGLSKEFLRVKRVNPAVSAIDFLESEVGK